MDKLFAIIRREYVESVRTKAFMISMILVPALMGALIFIPTFLARSQTASKQRIALIDRTGAIHAALERELGSDPNADFALDGSRLYELVAVPEDQAAQIRYKPKLDETGEPVKDNAGNPVMEVADPKAPVKILDTLKADGLLDVPPEVIDGSWRKAPYYSHKVSDFQPLRRIEKALNVAVVGERMRGEGSQLETEKVKKLTQYVDMRTVKLGKGGGAGESDFQTEYFTALFFTIGLYTTTLMAGIALSRGLIEEKSNRVIEVLLSSVTPMQLMTGKIIGHALVILTQIVAWSLLGAALSMRGLGGQQARDVLGVVGPAFLLYLVAFYLLGYLFYASLFAAVGAMSTTEMEAQQIQTPLVMMQIIPMIIAIAVVRQPDGGMATALSLIPFFAPSIMMMRLAIQTPPFWQLAASIVIMLVSIVAAFWVVSKIFRIGILMTGKRMTVPEVMRWLRAS